ncbi:hypothetical protein [Paenibacillus antibioticophila]|uniref:hypothetical protein n=1 Tax=Paenibacillus antibioticophila TaxID=1274374 RepID=UPI0005C8262F|nr:hypothetical protein [Paenibacillus antibioticophila]
MKEAKELSDMFSLSSFVFGCSEQKDIKFQENRPRASLVKFLTLARAKTGKSIIIGNVSEDFSLKWGLSVIWRM